MPFMNGREGGDMRALRRAIRKDESPGLTGKAGPSESSATKEGTYIHARSLRASTITGHNNFGAGVFIGLYDGSGESSRKLA